MARTRGSPFLQHDDDGVLVDKEGNPIASPVSVRHMDDGELGPRRLSPQTLATPVAPQPKEFVCDRATVRNLGDPYELFLLLEHMMGPIKISVTAAEHGALDPNIRRFFRAVF